MQCFSAKEGTPRRGTAAETSDDNVWNGQAPQTEIVLEAAVLDQIMTTLPYLDDFGENSLIWIENR